MSYLIALALLLAPAVAHAADAYRIGMIAAVTGPQAATYAPTFDAYRAYFKRVNEAGGVHGHPVEIQLEDDRGEPARAAEAAKKLGAGALTIVVASLSSTYGPVMTEGVAAKVPMLFGGGVCPNESFPPAHPLIFCSTSFGARWDSRFAVPWIAAQAAGKRLKVGFVAAGIPTSQAEMEFAETLAREHRLDTVPVVVVAPAATDFTAVAARLKNAGVDWIFTWAPWPIEIGVFEAMRRAGWKGSYLLYGHQPAQEELTRRKDPGLFAFGANAMFVENLAVHAEIRDRTKGVTTHPPHYMAEGWVSAMVLEDALRRCGWPCGAQKLTGALTLVNVDTRGLRGSAIEWTADNHYRLTTSYKVYRWDAAASSVAPIGDWTRLEVKER